MDILRNNIVSVTATAVPRGECYRPNACAALLQGIWHNILHSWREESKGWWLAKQYSEPQLVI